MYVLYVLLYVLLMLLHRLPDSPVCELVSTLILPDKGHFPFEYKYYVPVSSNKQDCFEHLSHPRSGGKINRYIHSTDRLLPGKEGMH